MNNSPVAVNVFAIITAIIMVGIVGFDVWLANSNNPRRFITGILGGIGVGSLLGASLFLTYSNTFKALGYVANCRAFFLLIFVFAAGLNIFSVINPATFLSLVAAAGVSALIIGTQVLIVGRIGFRIRIKESHAIVIGIVTSPIWLIAAIAVRL